MKFSILTLVTTFLFAPAALAQNWVSVHSLIATASGAAVSADGRVIHWSMLDNIIYSSTNSGALWQWSVIPGVTNTSKVVCSADGSKVALLGDNAIYISSDTGNNWIKSMAPSSPWISLAMSDDGQRIFAVDFIGGKGLWQSEDGGASWSQLRADSWRAISCSGDGSVILVMGGTLGTNLLTTNGGNSWAGFPIPGGATATARLSGDGTTIIAPSSLLIPAVFVSTNQGATWKTNSFAPGTAQINVVDLSSDGRTLIAGDTAAVHRSEDGGLTWANELVGISAGAVSRDGRFITVAVPTYGSIYVRSSGRPVIVRPPAQKTVVAFTNLTFSTSFTGATPIQLRWFFNDDEVGTNASLTLSNLTQSGTLKTTVENSFGADSATNTVLTVAPAAARISLPGLPNVWGMGAVVATGFGNTTAWFEWGVDTNYGNLTVSTNFTASASSLTMFVPMPLDLGVYHVRAVLSNAFGMAYSADARYVPSPITATMDSGTNLYPFSTLAYAWFERGYPMTNRSLGLPAPGTIIASESDPNIRFQFASSYSAPNAILVDSTKGGSFTLINPAPSSNLAFLTAAGSGAVTVRYTLRFADDSTESGVFVSDDWFNGTNRAFTANARVNVNFSTPPVFPNSLWQLDIEDGIYGNPLFANNPRLYTKKTVVTNETQAIRQIELSYDQGKGHAAVFAVSGSTDGTVFAPIAVRGFTEDMIVEAQFSGEPTVFSGGGPAAGLLRALPGVRYEIWSSSSVEGTNWGLTTNIFAPVKSDLPFGAVDVNTPMRVFKARVHTEY